MRKTLLTILTIAYCGAFSSTIYADENLGWYIGVGAGLSEANMKAGLEEGVNEIRSKFTVDDQDDGWKVFGGYQLTDILGVEAGYTDLGSQGSRANVGGIATATMESETKGVSLSVLGNLDVLPFTSLQARAGVYRWDTDVRAVMNALGSLSTVSESDDGTDLFFGLGAKFTWGAVGARLEWERFDSLGETDFDLYTFSLLYTF